MSLELKNLIVFQERENFEGKKEKLLIIDCDNCPNKDNISSEHKECYDCFLKNFYLKRHHKLANVMIKKYQITISELVLKKYLDYFKIINNLKKIWRKIEFLKNKQCIYEEFNCKLYSKDKPLLSLTSNAFLNPIFIYLSIKKKCETINNVDVVDITCKKCAYKIYKFLNLILEELNKLDLINDLKENLKQDKDFDINYYKRFLGINDQILDHSEKQFLKENLQTKKLINIYNVGDYDLFRVHIYEIPFEHEKRFSITFSIERNSEESYQSKLLREISSNIHLLELTQKVSLEALIAFYQNKATRYINTKYSFNPSKTEKIAFLAALQKINLLKLFPLLIDDSIEEIFLDSPTDKVYINHQNYGRCRTDLSFSLNEIERIKTLLRLYSGKRLDYSNPSLKYILKNKYFCCRFAVDIDPIHSNKFGMDIRKLNKNIFTIQDLLKNGTFNSSIAAFLYYCILRRVNLTVTGETDTGKTTLINALDLITPKQYRKVYVEDITESLNQSEFKRHQIKFKVDSIESMTEKKYSKQNQIKNLLHRSPDIIYLGEILTKEEAEAMFHCLAAGLRGFQTIHSKDLDSLINRFIHHFNINRSCLNDLDLVILMKKSHNRRKVISVSEITDNIRDTNKLNKILFLFNPEILDWEQKSDLFTCKTIHKLKMIDHLTINNFNDFFSLYIDLFQFLIKIKKLTNQELIELFDKINYLSFKSYSALKNYWQEWKKYRSLNH